MLYNVPVVLRGGGQFSGTAKILFFGMLCYIYFGCLFGVLLSAKQSIREVSLIIVHKMQVRRSLGVFSLELLIAMIYLSVPVDAC